jgi:radical SAM superfamily enzyme YgiQ (UPF0313 family)
MKVLLIDPPHAIFKYFRGRMPFPGLVALSAYLEKDFEVAVCDGTVLDHPWEDLEETVRAYHPDVVGIGSSSTSFVYDAMNTAYLVKTIDPKIITVGGGAHFSALPEESLQECPSLDYIVVGEGEVSMHELLRTLESRGDAMEVKGLAFRRDGQIVKTPQRPLLPNVDELPLPAYHLFPMDRYFMPSLGMDTHRSIILTTARGCEGECTFCSEAALWRNTWRPRSAKLVVDEMELLYRKFGKISFMFGDDIFNGTRQRLLEFAEELESRKLPIHFWFQTRVDAILRDADLLPRLKRLGLYMLSMGVETPSQKVLDNYNKKQTPEMARQAMEVIKKNGLLFIANVMWGDWEDTEETLKETLKFAAPYSAHFAIQLTTPLPGTEYARQAEAEGRIQERDYSKYDMLNPIMPTRTLSLEQVGTLHPRAIQRFYSRPQVFWDAFFSPNPFLRRNNQFFLKLAWETITRQKWEQKNYMPFEAFMSQKLGRPFQPVHGPRGQNS